MNLGNIPGYYFDEEKKKYFKVAPNNAVAAAQKYTKSNVRHEKNAAKRRKIDERWQKKRQAQTIKRSPLLSLSEYAGFGLFRETGLRSHAVDQMQADEAFVSKLRYKSLIQVPTGTGLIAYAHPMVSANRTALAATHDNGAASRHTYVLDIPGNISHSMYNPNVMRLLDHWDDPNNNKIASLWDLSPSIAVWPKNDPKMLFASSGGGQVFVGSIDYEAATQPSNYLTLGDDETVFWEGVFCPPSGDSIAIASSNGITHMDLNRQFSSATLKDSKDRESRAVDWLNPITIAGGSGNTTVLWDIRIPAGEGDTAARFHSNSIVTGMRTVPNSGGTQLLVSTNRKLALHDTRKASMPLLEFPILHETPRFIFDVSERGFVAANVRNGPKEEICLFSLRSGRCVRKLETPGQRATQLVWREDERGVEFLQGCIGSNLVKWAWEGDDSE